MSVNAVSQTTNGSCPHGLPPGACPVCSGGGGGVKRTKSRPVHKKGQWSYAKCYSVWQSMKAEAALKEAAKMNALRQAEFARNLQVRLNSIMSKIQNVATTITQMLPDSVRNVFSKVFNSVINPFMNLVSKIPQALKNIQNFLNDLKSQIISVSEKLTAIFGEIKNFIERKTAQKFKKLTKSLIMLFVFNTEDENYSNDDELMVFKSRELKKIRHAILSITRKGTQNENSA